MKGVVIFLQVLLLIVDASCDNEENTLDADFNSPRKTRCPHSIKTLNSNNIIQQSQQTQNDAVDESDFDRNPAKIPSLMDESTSIGRLQPSDIDLADRCFPKPNCNPSARFRTIDGGCNNLIFPVWGQINGANSRIIQASYSDGNRQPRKAVSGRELPNARHIRRTIFQDIDKPTIKHNLFIMQFGQMIAHDTELTVSKTSKCCNSDGSTPKNLPKDCLQITIPRDDPAAGKKRCFSSPRAADTSDLGCSIKPVRQQIAVTSFIDASLVYGSDNNTANSLRRFINGKLRKQVGSKGNSFLPNVKKASKVCNVLSDTTVCYASGDERVNQHPDMAVQTISLLRLHNTLCDELVRINPSWDDERLYQEARKIVIGMYQHVTYNEFLPEIIGKDYARVNNLLPLKEGFNNNYNEFLNPTTLASFTAAAFRSLHSYIQGFIELMNEARRVTSRIRLSDFYFKTDIVQRNDNFDAFTRGLLTQRAQEQDQFFTEEVSEFLFRVPNKTEGLDLVSLDLERGRDFGLPSYNKFRQLCGLNEAKTFDDLTDQISKKNVDALSKLYEHVEDVDYYAAGLLEKRKPGSILGHTFQCIIGEMFFRWKFGDRFFYEFGNQPGSFSLDQLQEIRKTTLAQIVCMTSDIQNTQRKAFNIPSNTNPLVSCGSIAKINLNAWRES
ncbi:Hypothetical protein CINCED_3A001808 [Cinara cedri]|uniref:Haem peroxidase,Haem peroxidase, animal type n=1 Tax=Cinara cedri TaxID=506608 RepID=A0A5E4LZ19_9HEMI|nr:Hypothetical protein CINCED_3A001808 [Cinara cedri]